MVIKNFIIGCIVFAAILMGIIILDLFLALIDLVRSYADLTKEKKRFTESQKKVTADFGQKLDYTSALLDMITILANIEVSSKLQSLSLIEAQYDVRKLDSDIKEICKRIFEGIKNDTFKQSTILSDDFLMHEIYEIVSMTLMEKMNDLNSSIIKSSSINK